jgi:hypothetical protein
LINAMVFILLCEVGGRRVSVANEGAGRRGGSR